MTNDHNKSNIKDQVRSQFGKAASDYATSDVHARGESLDWLVSHANTDSQMIVLDIATGAGHTAIRFAPFARHVIAGDITQEMLDQTSTLASELGVTNIETRIADAEALPFKDHSFDLVACRLAFHHFPDAESAIREMVRVLKPDGQIAFTDNFTSPEAAAAGIYNQFEQLRDPSHVIVRSLESLRRLFESAGLTIQHESTFSKRFEFHHWADRMRVTEDDKQTLLNMLRDIPDTLTEMMKPEWEGETMYFDLWEVAWIASLADSQVE